MNTPMTESAAALDMLFHMPSDWWYEQGLSWFVFTVIVSVILNGVRSFFGWTYRCQFSNWKLVLIGDDEEGQHQSLHWEEVRRILDSDFERWKLVKSVVAGAGWLSVTRIKPAEEAGWTKCDRTKKQMIIDFNKVPAAHLEHGCWRKLPQHLSDDALCQKECPKRKNQPQKAINPMIIRGKNRRIRQNSSRRIK